MPESRTICRSDACVRTLRLVAILRTKSGSIASSGHCFGKLAGPEESCSAEGQIVPAALLDTYRRSAGCSRRFPQVAHPCPPNYHALQDPRSILLRRLLEEHGPDAAAARLLAERWP